MLHQGLWSREASIQAPARSSPCGSSMAASTRPEQHAANSATERQGHDTSRRRRRPLLWGSKRSVVLGALVMAAAVAAKAVGGRGGSSCSRLATVLAGKAGATGAWHSSRQKGGIRSAGLCFVSRLPFEPRRRLQPPPVSCSSSSPVLEFSPPVPRGGGTRKAKPWQGPLLYHQQLTLQVESLTNLGMGVCRTSLPAAEGEEAERSWVVMVPGVIPGETVVVRVYRNHKNYSEADLLQVLTPAPTRVAPQCQLFGVCGGCQYQHMSISEQRSWKRRHVMEVLDKNGPGLPPGLVVNEVVGTEHVYGYRGKLTPHHDKPKTDGEIPEIGFLRQGSRSLVDVPACPIATPAINQRLGALRDEVRQAARDIAVARASDTSDGKKKKLKGATLFLRETTEDGVVTDTRQLVSDVVGGLTFQYTAGEFFQNNARVLPLMVQHVITQARAGGPAGQGLRWAVDTYCGGGLFCLSLSRHFESCFGVEISELAVESATRNAQINGITNCRFSAGTASDIFGSLPSHVEGRDTAVVIDPPRKGCDEPFLSQLFAFRPARVVYVSCDPATQARDAVSLVGAGYVMEDVTPFDLFPQTRHIENVITFRDARLDEQQQH